MVRIAESGLLKTAGDPALPSGDQIWQFDRRWRCLQSAVLEDPPRVLLEGLNSSLQSGRAQLCNLNTDTLALIRAIPNGADHLFSVRYLPDNRNHLETALRELADDCGAERRQSARLRQQLDDAQRQLDMYAVQVTEDLEELTWLRTLGSRARLEQSGNSTERFAEKVLPCLADLMRSETVALIRQVGWGDVEEDLPVIWQTGPKRLNRILLQKIVDAFADENDGSPVVRNLDRPCFADTSYEGVRNLTCVSVSDSESTFGWLLAVNKRTGHDAAVFTDPLPGTYMSEMEFGTFEASLMEAAATVLASHGRNCALLHEKEFLLRGVVRSMINAIDAKDSYTCGHSDRVAEFGRLIAAQMGIDSEECDRIYMTGLLHDIGKIGIPDDVLLKPGRLTDEEFDIIKRHPVIGYQILEHLDNFAYVLPGVLHHHESIDGSGYPDGLKGDSIPLVARILAVADAFDAMTSDRPYRRGMPLQVAENILAEGRGTQWDPQCIDAFFAIRSGVRLIAKSHRLSPDLP